MLARRYRFHGQNGLKAVYKRGQTVRSPMLSLKYAPRPGRPLRVGVVVSRKVSKSAVVRNRIRRRLYEVVRVRAAQLSGQDLVFTVYDEQLATLEAAKLQQLVGDLLAKLSQTSRPL